MEPLYNLSNSACELYIEKKRKILHSMNIFMQNLIEKFSLNVTCQHTHSQIAVRLPSGEYSVVNTLRYVIDFELCDLKVSCIRQLRACKLMLSCIQVFVS